MSDDRPFAFVLMPFDDEFSDIYRLGIKAPAEELGIFAQRVDEQLYKEGMLERIYNQIAAADMIVADMSGRNPNVFYEVGFAHARDKLCILLTSKAADIPFDLKHRRHVVYGSSIIKLQDEIRKELTWAKEEINNIQETRMQVTLKSCEGDLDVTKYTAWATLTFTIDLHNKSAKPSPEIEMAYFYGGPTWQLYQDGKPCPNTESDIDDFKMRSFLTMPIRKMSPNSWAQLQFEAKKLMAASYNGDEIKSKYKIRGDSILRLVTSEGNTDYTISINVEAQYIPF